MGANLSTPDEFPTTNKDPLDPLDMLNTRNMGLLWILAFQCIAMIWATCALVDRWRGPTGDRPLRAASVLVAMLLSLAWPVVGVYLMMN
jgi:hypothetical protein